MRRRQSESRRPQHLTPDGMSPGAIGARTTVVAVPFDPVRRDLRDGSTGMLAIVSRLPLTTCTTAASQRSATFASVFPAALRTVAVIVACALPSYRMRSGEAISTTDRPSVDGPVSPGADCSLRLQPASPATAIAVVRRRSFI